MSHVEEWAVQLSCLVNILIRLVFVFVQLLLSVMIRYRFVECRRGELRSRDSPRW